MTGRIHPAMQDAQDAQDENIPTAWGVGAPNLHDAVDVQCGDTLGALLGSGASSGRLKCAVLSEKSSPIHKFISDKSELVSIKCTIEY